ncbi:MAG: glycosyltransferase family 2 protein [Burkholderiaceae bacterium]|nr:glycosyltransferase family 2 protein [Burkholderiaceae bacterium]
MTLPVPPAISVVVPLYNKAPYLERFFESVRAQTFDAFEVVIVDDGSTDGSSELLARLIQDDSRFILHRQANGGVSRARNAAIAACTGHWIAFLDADDEWHPAFLATIVDATRRWPSAAMICTAHETRMTGLPTTNNLGLLEADRPIDAAGYFAAWNAAGGPPVFIGATAIRRDCLERCGGFEPGMNLGEELLTFIRVLEQGELVFIDRVLAIYHLSRSGSLATSPSATAVRMHEYLLDALRDQVRRGRCPEPVLARQLRIHVHHQMQHGMRRELWSSLRRAPTLMPLRVWLLALLEFARLREPFRRLAGRTRPS